MAQRTERTENGPGEQNGAAERNGPVGPVGAATAKSTAKSAAKSAAAPDKRRGGAGWALVITSVAG
ncbi:hypothetical protein, partial [Streptomyces sp. NPDC127574]|uniref:hypothetical protein n=1 Tax=Streptomyces sp. NPDC127574 TaxID=3345401 RepID=UPI003641078F